MRRTLLVAMISLAVVLDLMTSGCALCGRQSANAKWAMDDEQYAQEHCEPYSSDPVRRCCQTLWDRTDATFQSGRHGTYAGGSSTAWGHWPEALGSIGWVGLPTAWTSARLGLMGMDNNGKGYGGFEAGLRLHAPTRLTPYVGIASELGINGAHSGYRGRRNTYGNSSYRVSKTAGLGTINPEVGISYWLSSSVRLNAGASYLMARDIPDNWIFGISVDCLVWDGNGHWITPTLFPEPETLESVRQRTEDQTEYFTKLEEFRAKNSPPEPDPYERYRYQLPLGSIPSVPDYVATKPEPAPLAEKAIREEDSAMPPLPVPDATIYKLKDPFSENIDVPNTVEKKVD